MKKRKGTLPFYSNSCRILVLPVAPWRGQKQSVYLLERGLAMGICEEDRLAPITSLVVIEGRSPANQRQHVGWAKRRVPNIQQSLPCPTLTYSYVAPAIDTGSIVLHSAVYQPHFMHRCHERYGESFEDATSPCLTELRVGHAGLCPTYIHSHCFNRKTWP